MASKAKAVAGLHDEDDTDDAFVCYSIEVDIKASLIIDPDCYYDDFSYFIDEHKGDITFEDGLGNSGKAGEYQITRVRTDDAMAAGIVPGDLWDETQELCDYYSVLFDPWTEEFRPSLDEFGLFGRNVLILDLITILPDHRGRRLGLSVASRLIDLFGSGCDIVACQPSPLQFTHMPESFPDRIGPLALDQFKANEAAAKRKLRRYWGKLGFKQIAKGSEFYIFPMCNKRPSLDRLLRRSS